MPLPLTYPGVYVQELQNPVRPIVGVPTSVAAFVGLAPQGVVDYPFQVNSWADYENEFGSLDSPYVDKNGDSQDHCPLSYAVYMFFLNGGTTALVVRNSNSFETTAQATLPGSNIVLAANSPGAWGSQLQLTVDADPTSMVSTDNQFTLTIQQVNQIKQVVAQELYPGANLTKATPQYLPTMLAASQLVTLVGPTPTKGWTVPTTSAVDSNKQPIPTVFAAPSGTSSSSSGTSSSSSGTSSSSSSSPNALLPLGDPDAKTGMYALQYADIFNILCLPTDATTSPWNTTTLGSAVEFCVAQRAMLIVDPPTGWSQVPLQFSTITGTPAVSPTSANAAVYYPNLVITDDTGTNFNAGPCGAVAGVWASTDSSRGVWKAPAGTAATITGISGYSAPGALAPSVSVNDGESGLLNPLAVNALRTMPLVGPVVWGARTTVGADQTPNQWKYLPVRRLALYIEESLRRGTQWAVFEPNDEPLWSSLRLNVTTFMQGLFQQGAFEGSTPADAYLVQCDAKNNPQAQIDLGIVNILVGFAPLYPAEFVVISIQQQAGQA
jgi:phage tail sheath protein FI